MLMILRGVMLGHLRVFLALAVVVFAYLVLPSGIATRTRAIIAWDTGGVSFLLLVLHLFLTHSPDQMPAIAEAQEDGQWTIFWIALLASAVSFSAVTAELSGLKDLSSELRVVRVAFVAATLLLSWLLAHVIFAVRYAHEWYHRDDRAGFQKGLEFPGGSPPDYMDFLYFSMVLAMTFQVSDVQITSSRLRRLALLHGFVSFLYNTIIIALTVNVAAGLL
jgi:uncharacterized membrane protein